MMEWLWGVVEGIFRSSSPDTKLKIYEKANYVDDARTWISTFRKGTKYKDGKFTYSEDQAQEDVDVSREDITFREISNCLNSISEFLSFTFEKPSDFEDNHVPTLDFKIRGDTVYNQYTHSYFEKPMNSKWVVPSNSAMNESSKRQILANEMTRRLNRVDPGRLEDLATEVMNAYDQKLIFSGYGLQQFYAKA